MSLISATRRSRHFFIAFHEYTSLHSRSLGRVWNHQGCRSGNRCNSPNLFSALSSRHRKESLGLQTYYDYFPSTFPSGPPPDGPFTVDTTQLRKEFLQLQAKAHPDLHQGKDKARAEGASARINEAYKILQNSLYRSQYLLSLRGIDVAEDETAKVEDPELLMDVLEMRENIEAAEEEASLIPMKRSNEVKIQVSLGILDEAFRSDDLEKAKEEAVKLRYWINIKESLDDWEKGKPVVLFEVIFSDTYISDAEAESRLAYVSSSSSAKVKPTSSSSYDVSYSKETNAALSIRNNEGGSFTDDGLDSTVSDIPKTYEYMVLNSASYLCSIPQVSVTPSNHSAETDSKAEEEKELARAADRGWELLKDMEGHCLYFISGWWSYSFCYNHQVKQFHQLPPGRGGVPIFPPVEDEAVPAYVLGRFDDRRDRNGQIEGHPSTETPSEEYSGGLELAEMQAKGDMRYLVQKLSGGTTCDLTGKPRKVEVQFHCHPQSADRIGFIKEVSTCSYLMVIYTTRLCNDVAFLPPRETKAHPIICQEIVSDDELPEWESRRAASASQNSLAAASRETSRPTVGGIEIGGQKTVGKDGQRIEPPKPPQQRQHEEKVDVVAKADPNEKGGKVQRKSKEELKKMELDPETVELLGQELAELAGDKAWTLEVVDAPDGSRELRGIIEGEQEEEEEEEEGGGEL